MLKKLFLSVMIVLTALSLTACVMEFDNAKGMVSGALKEYKETVDLSDKQQNGQPMELNMDMKIAKAVLESTSEKHADVKFSYNLEELKPDFEVKQDEINIISRLDKYNFGKPVNIWDIKLTDKIPFDVKLKADASDVKLDMSRMLISKINAEVNASSAKLYFDEPNKEQLDKFKLNADASTASIYGAGNIGFETLDIDANASKLLIDLTGRNERDGSIKIDANASSVKLKVPDNVGVRIIIDNYEISSVRVNNNDVLSVSQKEYVSKNYKNAERKINVYADLNVTTLTIE